MGKQSTRENKTIYQLCREAAGLTRAEASEKMDAVSDSKIEKFEYETQEPTPYDILQMADAYKRPDLCNNVTGILCSFATFSTIPTTGQASASTKICISSPLITHKWRTNLDEITTRIIQPYKLLPTCKFC